MCSYAFGTAKSGDPDQIAPPWGAVWSGSPLFESGLEHVLLGTPFVGKVYFFKTVGCCYLSIIVMTVTICDILCSI